MRWALKIQDFSPQISHCPGKDNHVADACSRAPVGHTEEEHFRDEMDPPLHFSLLHSLTSSISKHTLLEAQQADDSCQNLMSDLPNGFIISDGILHKITNKTVKVPFIPQSLRHEILSYFHDAPHAGHLGIKKTMSRLLRSLLAWNAWRYL
jgi:hypothetical protein